ncbi:AMP-binding protein [Aeromicrobium sp. UC242_57]|uniref:AMP-binding protein n=1 Tax=Aeromicrobium sp. UC242_57 TaxID=3374624 RepID=UPI00379A5EA4
MAVDDAELADLIARAVARADPTIERRLEQEPQAHLDLVVLTRRAQEVTNDLLHDAVASARAAGASWEAIGSALGMSRQAAQQRFGRRPEPIPGTAEHRQIVGLTAFNEIEQLNAWGRHGWHSIPLRAVVPRRPAVGRSVGACTHGDRRAQGQGARELRVGADRLVVVPVGLLQAPARPARRTWRAAVTASLRPVTGSPRDVFALVQQWVRDAGDPVVVRTSGSTGKPKDVVLSHAAMLASAHATLDRLGGPGGWLQAMPVTGVGGLQVLVRSALAGLEPVFVDEHPSLAEAVAAIPGERRYASLVPTQVHRVLESGAGDVLEELDALLIGGASTPQDLLDRLPGVNVVRTYGMSETCGGCVYDGLPLDGVSVRLDEQGQVLLSGPMLFDGYADPAATAAVMRDGWFLTADLGELVDGRLRITGRRDDVVISGGVNISLPAVTAALRQLDGVRDAVAVGVDDPEWGARVVGYLVPDDAVCLDGLRLDEVRDAVEESGLPRTWAPREVRLLDALPLLPGGKIDRQSLKR